MSEKKQVLSLGQQVDVIIYENGILREQLKNILDGLNMFRLSPSQTADEFMKVSLDKAVETVKKSKQKS